MKKCIIAMFVLVSMLSFAGEKVNMKTVINSEIYLKKGFSSRMVTSMEFGDMKRSMEALYYVKNSNVRMDSKDMGIGLGDTITISKMEKEKPMIYMYYPKKKGYIAMDLTEEQEKANNSYINKLAKDEFFCEYVGDEDFAGVKAAKYKMVKENVDSEIGDMFMYVDKSKKMIIGSSTKGKMGNTKTEYKDVKIGVDDSVFELIKGYKKYGNMAEIMAAK